MPLSHPLVDTVLADRPVAAYALDGRGTGFILVDLCGTYGGTYTISAGATTSAILPGFTGAMGLISALSNRARSAGNVPASLQGNPTFSIEMFILPRAFATLPYNGWGLSGGALNATGLWCANSSGRLSCEYAGGNQVLGSTAATLVLNQVNHVVYTKTPGAAAATSKFYVNGVDTGSCTGSAGTPSIGASQFTVGQWADYNGAGGDSANAVHQFTAFYDKALDLATVIRHMRIGLGQDLNKINRLR